MLLKLTFSGGILIILVLALRFLALDKLPKRVFAFLWDIVLIRLIVPFYISVPLGLSTPIGKLAEKNVSGGTVMSDNMKHMASFEKVFSREVSVDWKCVVWFIGMIVVLSCFCIGYRKECQRIKTALPVSKEEDERLRQLVSVPGRVKILVSDRVFTPLTYGVISPKIIFPKLMGLEHGAELKYALAHELTHIKRADNFRKIVMAAAVGIHWFNPFVWLMYLFFNRDMELSCDEKVISHLGVHQRKEYAAALISLAEKQYHWSLFSNGFGSNAVKERMVAVMKFKKVTAAGILCSVVLIGAAMSAFVGNGSESSAGRKVSQPDNTGQFKEHEKDGMSYGSVKENSNVVKDEDNAPDGTSSSTSYNSSKDDASGGTSSSASYNSSKDDAPGGINTSNASEVNDREDGGNDLKKYKPYGITYDSSSGIWSYKGRRLAGLRDGSDTYIYGYGDGGDPGVYLLVKGKSLKVVTKKQFLN